MASSKTKQRKADANKPDTSDWIFCDVILPAHVQRLFFEDKLTATDLKLVMRVAQMVKHYGDGSGRGCFALNRTIAKWLSVHPVYVSERLNHLAEMGIILIIQFEGRRYLELEWSRTSDERMELADGYGEVLQAAYQDLQDRLGKGGKGKPLGGGKGKPLPPNLIIGSKKEPPGCPTGNGEHSNSASAASNPVPTKLPEGKLLPPQPKNKEEPNLPVLKGFGRKLAEDTYRRLLKAGKVRRTPKLASWGRLFDQLATDVKANAGLNGSTETYIHEIVTDHLDHIKDRYQPKCYSAESICREFARLEDAMERRNEEDSGTRPVRLLVGRMVWEQKANGNKVSRQVLEEVTRRRKGEWVEGDHGRWWDAEPLENLLRDGESLIREIR